MPGFTMADDERWAVDVSIPTYSIGDEKAIKVTDATVEIICDEQWAV